MKKILTISLILLLSIGAIAKSNSKMPIIGISSFGESSVTSASLTYINSVKIAGGVPLVIPMTTDEEQLNRILDVIDGLVMTGGEDIDPLKYFGEEPHKALGTIVPERDAFDVLLIRMAVKKGIPVMGICRGHQVMNVAFGGTLYQDIPSQVKNNFVKHSQKAPNYYGTHTIDIEKGSLLAKLLGVNTVVVNSFHHQSVKDIAPGFKTTAVSKDGVIEAIEMIGNDTVFGVQFHPEAFVNKGDDTFLPIFKYLIDKSRKKK